MPVITISREYGSGGKSVAKRVCEMLGYTYFDKNMMAHVATEVGLSADEVVDFSEDTYKMRNFMDRLFDRRRIGADAWDASADAARSLQVEILNEGQCIHLVKETVLGAYKHDNVVIVGRGGQAILKEQPGVLHVRLNAPRGARALRVKDQESLGLGEATELVRRKDQATAAYLKRFYEVDWENPLLYHLIINTGKWELDAVAEMIVNALTRLKVIASE